MFDLLGSDRMTVFFVDVLVDRIDEDDRRKDSFGKRFDDNAQTAVVAAVRHKEHQKQHSDKDEFPQAVVCAAQIERLLLSKIWNEGDDRHQDKADQGNGGTADNEADRISRAVEYADDDGDQ